MNLAEIDRQRARIKELHPGIILFFHIGDYYETFGLDAITVNHVTGVRLVASSLHSECVMAGVNEVRLQAVLRQLTEAGHPCCVF